MPLRNILLSNVIEIRIRDEQTWNTGSVMMKTVLKADRFLHQSNQWLHRVQDSLALLLPACAHDSKNIFYQKCNFDLHLTLTLCLIWMTPGRCSHASPSTWIGNGSPSNIVTLTEEHCAILWLGVESITEYQTSTKIYGSEKSWSRGH